jgi:hypothetical protein
MRKLKIAFLSLVVILTSFTSCSDNESVDVQQNVTESTSMRTAINRLGTQLDSQGNIDSSRNPTGNMVFDFGFSIQFPITLIYNNDTTVTVNDIDELIDIAANVTDELYIDGVEFPINVEVFDEETGAIEVITINSEEEFEDLLDDIDFEEGFDCQCTEEYAPVCVEIDDVDGETFILTFPNACYAMCEGFEQADFLDSCEGDYDDDYENDCFEFNFPLNIITDDGETITIDSEDDLGNVTYDMYYFSFEFPITVTTSDDEVITVENEEALFDLFEDCYDDYEDCDLEVIDVEEALMSCDVLEVEILDLDGELVDINDVAFNANNELVVNGEPTVTDLGAWSLTDSDEGIILNMDQLLTFTTLNGSWELVDCDYDSFEFSNGEYILYVDLECEDDEDDDCDCPDEYAPVCVDTGNEIVEFDNMCELICEGFTQADIVDCEDDDDGDDDCTEEDYATTLTDCPWVSYGDQNEMTEYVFTPAGVVTIIDNDGNTYAGTWTITIPENGDAYVSFTADGNDVDTWYFLTCDIDTEVYTNSNTYVERDCE